MRHGSLFSGIGGFDLAAEWMGWENIFHCEWNPFGQKVLKHYWPKAISYEDITKTDFTIHRGDIDILTGGFPCQPYSMAGKRKGKEDERHLWPQMLRAIGEIQPRWVVGENVYGLVNWSGGLVFHEVQSDLEAAGYEVFPFLLPAAGVGAPHQRFRIWFVAHSNNKEQLKKSSDRRWRDSQQKSYNRNKVWNNIGPICKIQNATNTNSDGQHECYSNNEVNASEGREYAQRDFEQSNDDGDVTHANNSRQQTFNTQKSFLAEKDRSKTFSGNSIESLCGGLRWENFPTVSPICIRDDGLSDRLDSITFSKWRQESIKGGGNAIVPQVALQIFKAIQEFEINDLSNHS